MKKILIILNVFVLITGSCVRTTKKQTESKEYHIVENKKDTINSPLIEEDVAINGSRPVLINSLDIHLILSDSIFIGSPEKIEVRIINNSDHRLLAGNSFLIKRLEFGFWAIIPEFERIIWTDEGFEIEPKTKKTFNLNLDILDINLVQGKYRLEKEISILDTKEKAKLQLKKVCYQDEQNRYYEFITNSMDSSAEEVAFLYKKRWGIELLFKKMKQNFQLHYFYGENENAIRTQVWCTLIAQLLLTVVQKMAQTKKAFSVVASLIRIHLISLLDVFELLRSTNRNYLKKTGSPPINQQYNLVFL